MATFSPASAAAIARLRTYIPPPTTWHSLPLSRRAAVLILLFADKKGDLRVVLTMRAATLKSYAGQAALPGGKTDSLAESPLDTARREAWEEIGLPPPERGETLRDTANRFTSASSSTDATHAPEATISDSQPPNASPATPGLPYPFKLEHLCQLPTNLAKTELGVRPCVALLYATSPVDRSNNPVDTESMLIPRLDAKEVAAVFNARLHNFLKVTDEVPVPPPELGKAKGKQPNEWYKGSWTEWYDSKFRMHNFFVPVHGQVVTRPKPKGRKRSVEEAQAMAEAEKRAESESNQKDQTTWKNLHGGSSSSPSKSTLQTRQSEYPRPSSTIPYRDIPDQDAPDPLADLSRFRVFGMTARILVDCARVAYEEEPEFEHNSHFGDEAIIQKLIDTGRMGNERGRGAEFTTGELSKVLSGRDDTVGGLIRSKRKRQSKEDDDRSRL